MIDLPTPPASLQTVIAAILAGVGWSAPIPLTSLKETLFPACGGIYQVSFAHRDPSLPHPLAGRIAYVGQSGNLRQRCLQLQQGLAQEDAMPFTTPHVAAPSLWVWLRLHREAHVQVSSFPLLGEEGYSSFWREAVEDLVLAKVRQDAWRHAALPLPSSGGSISWYSPIANFGYFPAGWRSSTDRSRGIRGGPRGEAEVESEAERHKQGPDVAPQQRALLADKGSAQPGGLESPTSQRWAGYDWSAWKPAREVRRTRDREQVGLYRLAQPESEELVFVGSGRLSEAARKASRLDADLLISSVAILPSGWVTQPRAGKGVFARASSVVELRRLSSHLWFVPSIPERRSLVWSQSLIPTCSISPNKQVYSSITQPPGSSKSLQPPGEQTTSSIGGLDCSTQQRSK